MKKSMIFTTKKDSLNDKNNSYNSNLNISITGNRCSRELINLRQRRTSKLLNPRKLNSSNSIEPPQNPGPAPAPSSNSLLEISAISPAFIELVVDGLIASDRFENIIKNNQKEVASSGELTELVISSNNS